ncbi:nicotinate-nucleotide adenylyltransferase [Weissella viridescens]|uniref:nicotinate-nucleotide adenylyltransferase n=1 Tax=Weissella viridescens TaxID=1629 RepID=UPI001C7D35C1|nr:nicotinate-nucleotide adenylyltransferase [Weissella viridescens]MBX4172777.1 nicotinate-nucleotide adenylyltransferase [Weissella viridescens]MCB6840066.1 nicotinate-nucleotide adenylyltransferase [Weissella viridescens]MCB6846700.1 nicotinate-nucleotide adenylyltransferase [Weissella viridescens]WJI91898.1 nicotinate-nucleotide adenylyltransferase [Weissella viridescens]
MQIKTKIQVETATVTDDAPLKVGILGGTFNPPHYGHLMIGEQVADQLHLDQIRFMPNALPPHVDEKKTIDAKDRVNMVRAAIMGNRQFDIELSEVLRGGKSYTYDTMAALKEAHPNVEYYFIIGGDEVAYLPTWHRIDELLELVHFVGVHRKGQPTETDYPVEWVEMPQLEISSTDIRQRIAEHRSVRYMVPDMVAAYIFKEGLYLND